MENKTMLPFGFIDIFVFQLFSDYLVRVQKFFNVSTSRREIIPNQIQVEVEDGSMCIEDVKVIVLEKMEERTVFEELSSIFEENEPSLEEVKEVFNVFDVNRDGFIDPNDLQRVLCVLGFKEGLELGNCTKMISAFDANGDGKIDFNHFVKFMETSL